MSKNLAYLDSKPLLSESSFSKIGGIDYSHNLVSIAREFLSYANISEGEAKDIDGEKYDCVSSFSAFHYFPSLEYAHEVTTKMIEKANKCVLFLDILDLDKKEADIAYKIKLCGKEEYDRLYSGKTSHLYYPREMFEKLAKETKCKIEIKQQDVVGYENSAFRFNVIMCKE